MRSSKALRIPALIFSAAASSLEKPKSSNTLPFVTWCVLRLGFFIWSPSYLVLSCVLWPTVLAQPPNLSCLFCGNVFQKRVVRESHFLFSLSTARDTMLWRPVPSVPKHRDRRPPFGGFRNSRCVRFASYKMKNRVFPRLPLCSRLQP